MKSIGLMYHDVYDGAPAEDAPPSARMYHVSRASFVSHLKAIHASGRPVQTVSESVTSEAESCMLLTFDDGWRGAFTTALPLMREPIQEAMCHRVARRLSCRYIVAVASLDAREWKTLI